MNKITRVICQWLYGWALLALDLVFWLIYAPLEKVEMDKISRAAYKKWGNESVTMKHQDMKDELGIK